MRIAIIPARGGSKGIPLKNLATIGGQSLIARCIATCMAAGLEAVVSTDHEGIADESRRAGAVVAMRPPYLSDDHCNSQEAIGHVLTVVKSDGPIVFAQCTSPMLTVGDIHGTLKALRGNDLAVCCVHFDGLVLDCDGEMITQKVGYSTNRQNRAPQYLINGHCWAFERDYLGKPWMSGRIGIHVAEFPYRLEIDTPADLELARSIMERA